jgi:hypothetical protein
MGETIVELGYSSVESFKGKLARVSKNRQWGVIDEKGKEISVIKYDFSTFVYVVFMIVFQFNCYMALIILSFEKGVRYCNS